MTSIIQIVQHLRPGGLEVMSLELMNFSRFRPEMKILSLEGDLDTAVSRWPRLAAYQDQLVFMDKNAGLTPKLILDLKKQLHMMKADVVHTHHIGPFFYGGLAARLAGIPHIHTEHDAWHYDNSKHRLLHRLVSCVANPVEVADADVVAQQMLSKLGIKNIQVIKNGVDTDKFVPGNQISARLALHLPTQVKLIGASGRLEEVKGHDVLIHALSYLPEQYHLAIAGAGSQKRKLKAQVDALGLSERVHFLGYVDNMPQFYQSLDLFCLPSFNEGFPLAPLEAQSCGVLTAVTNVGGALETLCPRTGVVLSAGDEQSMAHKLHDQLRQSFADNPRDYVSEHADIRTMAQAYDALTEAVCHG